MSRKIKVGIIGLGMGKFHLQVLRQLKDAQVLAIADVDGKLLKEISEEFNTPYSFTDYKALLELREIDAVCIATPNYLHAPMAIDAFKMGKHVLCEKPLAANVKEAENMVREAKKNKRYLMVGLCNRFRRDTQFLKDFIQKGKMGRIYYAHGTWFRRGEESLSSLNQRGWFVQREKSGGGVLIDLGVHLIDLALYLMNSPEVLSVSGVAYNNFACKMGMDVEDTVVSFLRLKGGATLQIELSWAINAERKECVSLSLFGTKAGAIMETFSYERAEPLRIFTSRSDIVPKIDLDNLWGQALRLQHKHFLECIRKRRKPQPDGEEGLKIMRIMEAIYKSASKGVEVKL
ncbi:Gfo/Idh/MocA family oxidoreductase [candidate division NPL-UPA2 bacterium]|nr:Gfo/Idh/MocA family oxidoreductase [candidate division NPL-UPA2 bacterium]